MRRQVGDNIRDNTRLRRPKIFSDNVGFRLLDSANINNQYYHIGVPDPPPAPEPYKIGPTTLSSTRAHRKSSFVILADGNNDQSAYTAAKSLGGSPIHQSKSQYSPSRVIQGRASPFRPRGFKGPLPHAQSRPPSPPPEKNNNQPRRFIQPQSLSQGNSPRKQSLIPQPRGGLLSVRLKNQKNSANEKWDRNNRQSTTRIPRSNSLKVPQKRAIVNSKSNITKPVNKTSIGKNSVKKPVGGNTEKNGNRSPTKIPVRNTPNGRFIQIAEKKSDKEDKSKLADKSLSTPMVPSVNLPSNPSANELKVDEPVAEQSSNSSSNSNKSLDKSPEDPGIIDLLKQSSGGSGTSSVVNATTTTAVQPLRIDAAKILPKEEQVSNAIENSGKQQKATSRSVSPELKEVNKHGVDVGMNVEAVVETAKDDDKKEVKEEKVKKEIKKDKDDKNLRGGNVEAAEKTHIDPSINSSSNSTTATTTSSTISTPAAAETTTTNAIIENHDSSVENQRDNQTDKLRNHGSEASLKSSNGLSTCSVESNRSTDTGVSVNTVRGVSSAREKRGTHIVKKSDEIETLSGNLISVENHNGEPAIVEVTEISENAADGVGRVGAGGGANQSKVSKFAGILMWKDNMMKRFRDRWSKSQPPKPVKPKKTRLNCLRMKKKKPEEQSNQQEVEQMPPQRKPRRFLPETNFCSTFKSKYCGCKRWRSKVGPAESTSFCPEKNCCALSLSWCRWPSCCSCNRDSERKRSIRAKHSLTSVAPPPISEEPKSKIPDVLIEHSSVMRGAIPCLPVPLAWFCLLWNVLVPGSGTIWSGLFNLCVGQPRFASTASAKSRFGAFIVNIIVGISQLFTVLFCLVGWGWSIWWAVTMIRLARKWKRFKAAELNSDLEARGNDGSGQMGATGVPTQALRGMERAR